MDIKTALRVSNLLKDLNRTDEIERIFIANRERMFEHECCAVLVAETAETLIAWRKRILKEMIEAM